VANRIRSLLNEFKNVPFPLLGKELGDFPLYDSLLAGIASSLAENAKIDLGFVPAPDKEAQALFDLLKSKSGCTPEEAQFLKYYRLLEELRHEIIRAAKAA
jgi:hypothetical protein